MIDISPAFSSDSQLQQVQQKRVDDKLQRFSKKDIAGMSTEQIRKVAQEFESFFLSQVLGHITQGIKTDGLFGGGHAENIYRGMMNEEYGKSMAQRGGLGIGDMLFKDMMKLQQQYMSSNNVSAQEVSEAYLSPQAENQKHPSVKSVSSSLGDQPNQLSQRSTSK